jgi:hypothetical protein
MHIPNVYGQVVFSVITRGYALLHIPNVYGRVMFSVITRGYALLHIVVIPFKNGGKHIILVSDVLRGEEGEALPGP